MVAAGFRVEGGELWEESEELMVESSWGGRGVGQCQARTDVGDTQDNRLGQTLHGLLDNKTERKRRRAYIVDGVIALQTWFSMKKVIRGLCWLYQATP